MSGPSLLIVSPSRLERSRVVAALIEHRSRYQVLQSSDLVEAAQVLNTSRPDLILLSRSLDDQPDLIGFKARAAVLGAQLVMFRVNQTLHSEGPEIESTAIMARGLKDLLVLVDDIDRHRSPERSLPRHPHSAKADLQSSAIPTALVVDPPLATADRSRNGAGKVVLIGASTGGIDALVTILSQFPLNCPPTAIVQHTGRGFSVSLARVLARNCAARVTVAEHDLIVEPGMVCLAGGLEGHLHVDQTSDNRLRCSIRPGPKVCGQIPSIDTLFHSALPFADKVIGVILTGMGSDGAAGLRALRQAGAATIGQDEASSVIYGMPRVAQEIGAVQHQLPLSRIGPTILKMMSTPLPRARSKA